MMRRPSAGDGFRELVRVYCVPAHSLRPGCGFPDPFVMISANQGPLRPGPESLDPSQYGLTPDFKPSIQRILYPCTPGMCRCRNSVDRCAESLLETRS